MHETIMITNFKSHNMFSVVFESLLLNNTFLSDVIKIITICMRIETTISRATWTGR